MESLTISAALLIIPAQAEPPFRRNQRHLAMDGLGVFAAKGIAGQMIARCVDSASGCVVANGITPEMSLFFDRTTSDESFISLYQI